MPWWSWILVWGGALLLSAAVVAGAAWRTLRAGLRLIRELADAGDRLGRAAAEPGEPDRLAERSRVEPAPTGATPST